MWWWGAIGIALAAGFFNGWVWRGRRDERTQRESRLRQLHADIARERQKTPVVGIGLTPAGRRGPHDPGGAA